MKPFPLPRTRLALLLLASAAALDAALTAGGTAYTKRHETNLLAEPSATAAPTGRLAYGRKLKIESVKGAWLRVSDGAVSGWVFAGNVSETQPAGNKGLGALDLSASATTATAAARPLSPSGDDYAATKNLGAARDDLNWLLAQCHALTPAEVEAFLKEQKKGEYQ